MEAIKKLFSTDLAGNYIKKFKINYSNKKPQWHMGFPGFDPITFQQFF